MHTLPNTSCRFLMNVSMHNERMLAALWVLAGFHVTALVQ